MEDADDRENIMSNSHARLDWIAETLWNRSMLGLAFVGKNGEWLKVNSTLCDIVEYNETELLERTFQDITHPDDVDSDVDMVEKMKRGEIDHYVMSKRYLTKTGRVVWIKLRVDAVIDPDTGEFMHFLSQISPPLEVEPGKVAVRFTPKHHPLKSFIRENWKWLIAAVIAAGSFLLNEHYEYRSMQDRIDSLERIIVESQED